MTANVPALRPYGIGELLDQAIRLYRRNFQKFIGIMALIQVPVSILQLLISLIAVGNYNSLLSLQNGNSGDVTQVVGRTLLSSGLTILSGILSFFLVQGIATAALTRSVANNYLGCSTGILESYKLIGSSWKRLIGAILLVILLSILLWIWLLIPCIGWFSGLGMILFASMAVWPLVSPVVVLERHGAAGSLRRAWELARRRFWWILGFVLILYLFAYLVVTGPTMLMSYLLRSVFGLSNAVGAQATLAVAIQSLVTMVTSLLYLPLQLTAITLLYFDLRVRTEGFDLAMLANDVADQPLDIEVITAQTPLEIPTPVVTSKEFGYFVLLSIIGGILYALLVGVLFGLMSIFGPMFGLPVQ